MKAAFIFGTPIKKDENDDYYLYAISDAVLSRYLEFADSLTLAMCVENVKKEDVTSSDTKISTENITVVDCPRINNLKSLLFERSIAKRKIKEIVKNADFIIARVPSRISNYAIKYAAKLGKPCIVEVVGCPWDAYWNHSFKGKIMAPFLWRDMKKSVKRSKHVIYVSRRFLQKRYPNKNKWTACPDVVLDKPQQSTLLERIEKIREISPHKQIVLGLIGSLDVAYRGHETAIKALSELKKRGFNCKLRLLGPGKMDKWEELAGILGVENEIEYCGALPAGEAVMRWIDNIDILVMPTKQETLGRAVIEAMSRACPVLGSIETAIPEQLGSDCVLPARNYMMLADYIQRMLRNKEYMEYCALENFYRSFKYTNEQTDLTRRLFIKEFISDNFKA